MPVSIRIEARTGLAIATCSGLLRLQDAREGVAQLWTHPDWPGRLAVWDYRDAEFDISPADVRTLAAYVLRHQPSPPPQRVAFVAPRDVDFGMARMFEVFRDDPATAFHVFRDFDEAVSWVRAAGPNAG